MSDSGQPSSRLKKQPERVAKRERQEPNPHEFTAAEKPLKMTTKEEEAEHLLNRVEKLQEFTAERRGDASEIKNIAKKLTAPIETQTDVVDSFVDLYNKLDETQQSNISRMFTEFVKGEDFQMFLKNI